jgi:hypothetical protein
MTGYSVGANDCGLQQNRVRSRDPARVMQTCTQRDAAVLAGRQIRIARQSARAIFDTRHGCPPVSRSRPSTSHAMLMKLASRCSSAFGKSFPHPRHLHGTTALRCNAALQVCRGRGDMTIWPRKAAEGPPDSSEACRSPVSYRHVKFRSSASPSLGDAAARARSRRSIDGHEAIVASAVASAQASAR